MSDVGGTAADPRLEHMMRGTLLTWWAEQFPDRLAVAGDHGERTFAQLDARANQLVRALRRRGAEPGSSLALMLHNCAEWAEVWAACCSRRLPPHADQLAPHRRRGRLHRRRLRCNHVRRRRASRRRGCGGGRGSTGRHRPPRGRRPDRRLRRLRGRRERGGRRRARRRRAGRPDAVHVGHHRSTERRDARRAAARRSRWCSRGGRRTHAASSTTDPARTSTCAAGRCTTRRRWRSHCPCRSRVVWVSCSWTTGTRRRRSGSSRSTT